MIIIIIIVIIIISSSSSNVVIRGLPEMSVSVWKPACPLLALRASACL